MINELRNIHQGKTIAVLGSGPSLGLFQGLEDVTIATNGAADIEIPYQYFMCEDLRSPTRPWWKSSEKHKATRIIGAYLTPNDDILYPDQKTRNILIQEQNRLTAPDVRKLYGPTSYIPTVLPQEPHKWFLPHPLSPRNIVRPPDFQRTLTLLCGGSIGCTALQMAFIMGAGEIHLYGCSMDNERGDNYHFINHGKIGKQESHHLPNFQLVIDLISKMVSIKIHGPSKFTQTRRLSENLLVTH